MSEDGYIALLVTFCCLILFPSTQKLVSKDITAPAAIWDYNARNTCNQTSLIHVYFIFMYKKRKRKIGTCRH